MPLPDEREHREAAARQLRWAYSNGPIAPLRLMLQPADIEGAYAVQDFNTRFWTAGGRRVLGYKIGLTAPALQQRLGVDEPDYGVLFEDMMVEDGGKLGSGSVQQSKVEGEIAIVLGTDIVEGSVTAANVRKAIALALPAIEIVGSRIADWAITAADTIADNASSGAFVVGELASSDKLPNLAEARMNLRIDGKIVGRGKGSAALGDPLEALAWLARKAIARGRPLRTGDIILTGALAPMVPLPANALVEVEVEGLGGASFRSA